MSDKKLKLSGRTGILLCLGILVAALLGAGCTGIFSGTRNTGTATVVPQENASSPARDTCTFDRQMENRDSRFPHLDSCYFGTHTPMEYLNDLHLHPHRPSRYPVCPVTG